MKSMIFPPKKASYVELLLKPLRRTSKRTLLKKTLTSVKHMYFCCLALFCFHIKSNFHTVQNHTASIVFFCQTPPVLTASVEKRKSFSLTGNKRKKHPVHFLLIQNKTYICSDVCIPLAVIPPYSASNAVKV